MGLFGGLTVGNRRHVGLLIQEIVLAQEVGDDGAPRAQRVVGIFYAFVVAVATVTAAETPSYMRKLWEDLTARKKLFEETPEEEIKYWFEYAGPLQVSYCTKGSKRQTHGSSIPSYESVNILQSCL